MADITASGVPLAYETPAVSKALDSYEQQKAKRLNGNAGEAGFSSQMILGKFEEGVKLMIATLKHQNPDNPMDPKDIAQQFSMFAQLMGMADIKKILTQMSDGMQTDRMLQAASQLDNFVKVKADTFNYTPLEPCELGFYAPGEAKKASIIVTDMQNRVVRTIEGDLGDSQDGYHGIIWDGKDFDGENAKPGQYQFRVMVMDEKGEALHDNLERPIAVETTILGRVIGGSLKGNHPHVRVGARDYPLNDLISIQSRKAFKDYARAAANKESALENISQILETDPVEGVSQAVANLNPDPSETVAPVLEDLSSLAHALQSEKQAASHL